MYIILDAFQYVALRGVKAGAGLGAIYGSLIFPVIGTFYGLGIGAAAGFLTGAACGLFAGILTRLASNRHTKPLRYTRILTISCAFLGVAIAYLSFSELLPGSVSTLLLPPTFIAGCAAIYVALGYVQEVASGRYEKVKRKRDEVYD
jgi:hypothetical protein